jgi:hypothetical protein
MNKQKHAASFNLWISIFELDSVASSTLSYYLSPYLFVRHSGYTNEETWDFMYGLWLNYVKKCELKQSKRKSY